MLGCVMDRKLPWPLLLLLVLVSHSSNICLDRDLHYLEMFAGSAAFSKACAALELRGQSHDLGYSVSMDILSPAGFVSGPRAVPMGSRAADS